LIFAFWIIIEATNLKPEYIYSFPDLKPAHASFPFFIIGRNRVFTYLSLNWYQIKLLESFPKLCKNEKESGIHFIILELFKK